MKEGIHPEYFETVVTCGCGNQFQTRSHSPRAEGRYLQRLPSVLHGQVEVYRHGGTYREIPDEIRGRYLCQLATHQEEGRQVVAGGGGPPCRGAVCGAVGARPVQLAPGAAGSLFSRAYVQQTRYERAKKCVFRAVGLLGPPPSHFPGVMRRNWGTFSGSLRSGVFAGSDEFSGLCHT